MGNETRDTWTRSQLTIRRSLPLTARRRVALTGTEKKASARFAQLTKVVSPPRSFSITDVGCGYGALFDYLERTFADFHYCGIDVSADMIAAARARIGSRGSVGLGIAAVPPAATDYAVASGIFNVCAEQDKAEWRAYMNATLADLHRCGRRGFAFNCLTSYSDADKMQPISITRTLAIYSISASGNFLRT